MFICITLLSSCGTGEVPFDLGNGYTLNYSANSYFNISNANNVLCIDEHKTRFGFDSRYIVAEQLPVNDVCECNSNCTSQHSINSESCIEVLKQCPIRFYFIIDKSKNIDNLKGPFSYGEFIKERKVLGCSVKLNKAFESAYMHYVNQGNIFTIIKDYKIYKKYLDSLNQTLEK